MHPILTLLCLEDYDNEIVYGYYYYTKNDNLILTALYLSEGTSITDSEIDYVVEAIYTEILNIFLDEDSEYSDQARKNCLTIAFDKALEEDEYFIEFAKVFATGKKTLIWIGGSLSRYTNAI